MTDIQDIYRLSPLQAGLLFQTLYEHGGQAYISQAAYSLRGALAVDHLRRVFRRAVARHDILRTAILWENLPEPVQVVLRDCEMELREHDWHDRSDARRRSDLDTFCRADRERGFDLRRPPLMRAHVIRTASDRFTLIWTWHHILLDGWSVAQLVPELLADYQAAADGVEAAPAPRRPYRDYIAWLQQQDLPGA